LAKRVLITGGAGFIGSHVAEEFLARGDEVVIVDDYSTGKASNVSAAAEAHEMNVDSPEFVSFVRASRFDLVVHLAAQMDVRKSVADPAADARTNILGAIALLEGIRTSGRPTRVVFSSTGGAVYGTFAKPPNMEIDAKDPESPYAIAKLSVEYYLAYYGRVHGIDCVSLRFGNVYGPRQDPHGEAGVVAIFCAKLMAGEPLTVFGDGLQTRDYVYVGDVSRAVRLAAEFTPPPQERLDSRAFNIGTGTGTSVLDLAAALGRVTGLSAKTVFAPHRPGEQQHSFLDPQKAGRLLGWRPEVELDRGLALTYQWFLDHASGVRPA